MQATAMTSSLENERTPTPTLRARTMPSRFCVRERAAVAVVGRSFAWHARYVLVRATGASRGRARGHRGARPPARGE
jgi:hypothetical protein